MRYQVDRPAKTFPSRCAGIESLPVGVHGVPLRSHHLLHHLSLLGRQLVSGGVRTGRLVRECTLGLPHPVVILRGGQADHSER